MGNLADVLSEASLMISFKGTPPLWLFALVTRNSERLTYPYVICYL